MIRRFPSPNSPYALGAFSAHNNAPNRNGRYDRSGRRSRLRGCLGNFVIFRHTTSRHGLAKHPMIGVCTDRGMTVEYGSFSLELIEPQVFASSANRLSRQWVDRLATYRNHRNDEHLEALIFESLRYAGFTLEEPLSRSDYWSKAPLARRVAVLLFLVDRGVVNRVHKNGRTRFEAVENAETWAAGQASLAPYLAPTLELIAALRSDRNCRSRRSG